MNYLHRFNDYKACKDMTEQAVQIFLKMHEFATKSENIDYEDKQIIMAAMSAIFATRGNLRRAVTISKQMLTED